jgi:hypothetical protein
MTNYSARRLVFIGTITAILGLAAGYSIAAFPTAVNSGDVGQNYAGVTPVNTVYAGNFNVELVLSQNPSSSGCTSGTQSTVTGPGTIDLYVAGAAGNCSSASTNWYEELSFTSSTLTAGQTYSDMFTVATTVSGTTIGESVTVPADLNTSGTVSVDLFVDSGPSSGSPASYSSLTVVIQGS